MKHIFLSLSFLICISMTCEAQMHLLNKDLPCVNRTFQVHAHVILDSLGVANYTPDDLRSALAGASEAFAPICIGFELCGIDTIQNYEFDSVGTGAETGEILNLFHVRNRINIYLASELQAPPICGFASLSGIAQMNNGMVFLKCLGSGTLIHEFGHLFGLLHTFEGDDELVDGSNCATEGDGICDTPADPFEEGSDEIYTEGCEFIWLGQDANGEYYQPDIGNYMSYYPCACGFSYDQYVKMANTYLNAGSKMW